MLRKWFGFCALWWSIVASAAAAPRPGTPEAAREAYAVFAGAEDRYQAPPERWFSETQQALRAQVERVGREFAAYPTSSATLFWKTHLRWSLLERNLGPVTTINLAELEEVRRWMYSNRQGLESPFFAPLRASLDTYLDAAYAASQRDLRQAFHERVALARAQCQMLAEDPSDLHAAALGRTLGWLERTRQLPTEVAATRSLTSLPNAQIVLQGELIGRIVATQASSISEQVHLSERVAIPPSSRWQRARTMQIRGIADTQGTVRVVPTPNDRVAELAIIYEGTVDSRARGATGPVSLGLSATGTARAVKPVYLGRDGLELGETHVAPHVQSHFTDVDADRDMVERIARRRAEQPNTQSLMNEQARATTAQQLAKRLDQHVEEAKAKIRGDFTQLQGALNQFPEVTAPLVREGVTIYFDGARSSAQDVEFNFYSRRREQHGAAAPCPIHAIAGDVMVRVHVSFLNNMAETITGGKTLSDAFLMKYAKILHAELPLPLMVHARAKRWALVMAKQRPIELTIPEANRLAFVVHIDAVEIDGVTFTEATTARMQYRLARDECGAYRLERDGPLALTTTLPADRRQFVAEKLGAFFGPVLDGGGVVIPEGGVIGSLQKLQARGVHADADWLAAAWDVPTEAVEDFIRMQPGRNQASDQAPAAVGMRLRPDGTGERGPH